MGIIDRIFGRPAKAVKRAVRQYKGAMTSRLAAGWVVKYTSADAEIYTSILGLRSRSRELVRDNDYAKSALRTIVNNVIGSGITLHPQVKQRRGDKLDDRTNRQIRDAWEQWCRKDNCHASGLLSFSDLERLIIRSTAESGEVFVRILRQQFGGSKIPLALEVIEADQVDHNYNVGALPNGGSIRMGIERDRWHRPIAFYFVTAHPGDLMMGAGNYERIKVPANEIIHVYLTERPGQTRGVPWFHTAILRMIHLGGYEEAEIVRARGEAAIMGFIESPELDALTDGEIDDNRVTDMDPGTIKHLSPGETFTAHVPNRAGGAFDPFVRAMLRGIAAGIGVSYEAMSKDYSQSNYSSSRLALLEDRDQWRILQSWIIENFHERVYETWLDMAVLSGTLALTGYEQMPGLYQAARFKPRGWSWVDPEKEIAAAKAALRIGVTTRTDIISEQGGDINDLMATLELEKVQADSLGLVFDSDASEVNGSGASQVVYPVKNSDTTNGA